MGLISVIAGVVIGITGIILIVCGIDWGGFLIAVGAALILLPVFVWLIILSVQMFGVTFTIAVFVLGFLVGGMKL